MLIGFPRAPFTSDQIKRNEAYWAAVLHPPCFFFPTVRAQWECVFGCCSEPPRCFCYVDDYVSWSALEGGALRGQKCFTKTCSSSIFSSPLAGRLGLNVG